MCGDRSGGGGYNYNASPGGAEARGAEEHPGFPVPGRRGPRVMAKGEGAESGSAAGLLPTGILQAGERPVQVKVRSPQPQMEGLGWGARMRWGRRGNSLVLGHTGLSQGQKNSEAGESSGGALEAGSDGKGL